MLALHAGPEQYELGVNMHTPVRARPGDLGKGIDDLIPARSGRIHPRMGFPRSPGRARTEATSALTKVSGICNQGVGRSWKSLIIIWGLNGPDLLARLDQQKFDDFRLRP